MFLDQISMSCDTEDWSNDAENSAKKLYFTIYSHRKHFFFIVIFQIFYCFHCIFDQINAALVTSFKHIENLPDHKILNSSVYEFQMCSRCI